MCGDAITFSGTRRDKPAAAIVSPPPKPGGYNIGTPPCTRLLLPYFLRLELAANADCFS